MYATCTFCHRTPGGNQSIEVFPVGSVAAIGAQMLRMGGKVAFMGRFILDNGHQDRLVLPEELADLERTWREAELVAGIADNVLVPRRSRRR